MAIIEFTKAEFSTSYGLASQLPKASAPEFVFAGRSNVGKSSLINKLCNRKRLARVSATPGKTATINYYTVGSCCLVDLPGYGYAKTSRSERHRWDELINGYFSANQPIVMLLQLLDCRHNPSKDDMAMLEYLKHYQIPFTAVLTKADKVKRSQYAAMLENFSSILEPYSCRNIILTSSEKGAGIEELKALMQQEAEKAVIDGV